MNDNEELTDRELKKLRKAETKTDYCNEFQDNQTTYCELNEPRTEEEAKAQEETLIQEAKEAEEDDVKLNNDRTDDNVDQNDSVEDIWKTDVKPMPFEFKYILKYTEKDDIDRVRKCLERYPHSINACDSDGYYPIHRACHNDNVELVKLLIDNGADVEVGTRDNWRPIHCAAYWGNMNVLDFLIKYGVNINALTHGNNTCLHFAVQIYERRLLEMMIYHPLMYMEVKNGSLDTAYELCKRKTENYELFHNILNEDAY